MAKKYVIDLQDLVEIHCSPNALLGGALLVEDIVGSLAREGLTETKLTAERERLWGRTTPCVPGSAGV